MPTRLSCLLLCAVSFTSMVAFAQAEPAWTPAPLPSPSPVNGAPAAPLATEPIKFGVQFHGDFQGSNTGFGPSVSVGLGFNRVALLFTPAFVISNLGPGSNSVSLSLAVRIYFKSRQQGAFVGFLKPDVTLGTTFTNFGGVFGALGLGGGGEYLLTRNLGFTAELGVRLLSAGLTLSTYGSLGIMLHT